MDPIPAVQPARCIKAKVMDYAAHCIEETGRRIEHEAQYYKREVSVNGQEVRPNDIQSRASFELVIAPA